MRVAGLISGTSVDGIDVAIADVGDSTLEVLGHGTVPYAPDVREAILAVSNRETHTGAIARLNFQLGELFAEALQQICKLPLASIELIGSHGQTIFHDGSSTLQIAEPAVIAARTGIPVIADFRTADIAAGGKGAPLVPFVDYRLFRHAMIGRVALNIGGIANITVLPAGAPLERVIAFDTGPGNMVIDGLTGSYDRDGALARSGRVDRTLLQRLLADPYYQQSPPKTAGREQYGIEFLRNFEGLRLEDAVATATELTVQTIAGAIARFEGIEEVIVSGGGAHNTYMMERLGSVRTSADFGIDIDAKEAIAFAILAYESFHGRPANVPSATGAAHPAILGKLCQS